MTHCEKCIHHDICESYSGLDIITFFPHNEDCEQFKPASDVAEVRHGEWVYYDCISTHDGAKSGFACSICSGFVDEDIFDMDEFNKDFCGACGAKMDGGKK